MSDRIALWVDGGDPVRTAADRHGDWIRGEVLATALEVGPPPDLDGAAVREVDLDGMEARIALRLAGR